MKKIKAFLKHLRTTPVYSEIFDKRESVFENFEKTDDLDIQILYAQYEYEDYSGSAVVIFYRKSTKKYYEVYGSHCSCYGLEGQWDHEEEVVPEELLKRIGAVKDMYEAYLKS